MGVVLVDMSLSRRDGDSKRGHVLQLSLYICMLSNSRDSWDEVHLLVIMLFLSGVCVCVLLTAVSFSFCT